MGIGPVHFLPPRNSRELPPVGPGTRYLLAQPFLADTGKALDSRGCQRLAAPFPLGIEGTRAWLEAAASEWGVAAERVAEVTAAPRERAAKSLRPLSRASRRQADLLLPGLRSSKFPSPASWRARWAWSWSRSARPICTAAISPTSWPGCRPARALSEGQDVELQLDRAKAERPDMIVCGLGLANPLEAEGLTTKWSIELLFTPIQGFEQAGDLAELFTRPFNRRARLMV